MRNPFRRKAAGDPFPKPKWPPIQELDSIDITGRAWTVANPALGGEERWPLFMSSSRPVASTPSRRCVASSPRRTPTMATASPRLSCARSAYPSMSPCASRRSTPSVLFRSPNSWPGLRGRITGCRGWLYPSPPTPRSAYSSRTESIIACLGGPVRSAFPLVGYGDGSRRGNPSASGT